MRKRRLHRQAAHLEITAFINLIVVLVPFLLSTAVFTRLAVLDLALPAPGGALKQLSPNQLQLEVVIRPDAFEVGDRVGGLIQRVDRAQPGLALKALNTLMVQVKQKFPDKTAVSVLAEPDTPYDHIVQVMDAVRAAPTAERVDGGYRVRAGELFPDISLGDAPQRARGAAPGPAPTAAPSAAPSAAPTAAAAGRP